MFFTMTWLFFYLQNSQQRQYLDASSFHIEYANSTDSSRMDNVQTMYLRKPPARQSSLQTGPMYYTRETINLATWADDLRSSREYLNRQERKDKLQITSLNTGHPLIVADLNTVQLLALLYAFFDNYRFETDFFVLDGEREAGQIVTIVEESETQFAISESHYWSPLYLEQRPRKLTSTYKIELEESEVSKWTNSEIGVLYEALMLLDEQERRLLEGATFIRDRDFVIQHNSQEHIEKHIQEDIAGTYHCSGDDLHNIITLYDLTFDKAQHTFVGDVSAPYTKAHFIILHEIGHLLARQQQIKEWRMKDRLNADFVALERKFTRRTKLGLSTNSVQTDINRLKKEIDDLERVLNLDATWILFDEFFEHKQQGNGPTLYAETSVSEAFAESYALYKLDPSVLKRLDPELYRWFDSKMYLGHIP